MSQRHAVHAVTAPCECVQDSGQAFQLQSMLSALTQSMEQRPVTDLPMHLGS